MYLQEAFRALDALNEDTFSVSDDGIKKLSEFEQNDDLTDEIAVIDMDAEVEDDLQPSYVGKVILDCAVCHSKLYKDKSEVNLNDDQTLANVGEECPYCYTSDGFKVIGEVAAFSEGEVAEEETSEEALDEGLFGIKTKKEKEKEAKAKAERAAKKKADKDGELEEFLDANVTLDARGFGGKDNNVSVLGGKLPGKTESVSLKESVKSDMAKKIIEYVADEIDYALPQVQDIYSKFSGYKDEWSEDGGTPASEEVQKAVYNLAKVVTYNVYLRYCGEDGEYEKRHLFDYLKVQDLDESTRLGESKSIKESLKSIDDILDTLGGHTKFYEFLKDTIESHPGIEDDIDEIVSIIWDEDMGINEEELASAVEYIIDDVLDESKSIKESLNNVNVETDDSVVNVSTDDTGKVTVTTEPITSAAETRTGDEMLAPLSDETEQEIYNNGEELPEDENVEEEEIDIEDFDEESFDELGESYLKSIYENVNSYKTSNVTQEGNHIKVEGIISFNSGNQKKTSFIFEAKDTTRSGLIRFIGENTNITRGKKAFTIRGRVNDKKFITESFNYNYRTKNDKGKSTRVYGTLRLGKRG